MAGLSSSPSTLFPVTYGKGRLHGIPRYHLHAHAGLRENPHRVLHANPRRVDEPDETQECQLLQFEPRSQGQHWGETRPTEVSLGDEGTDFTRPPVSPHPTVTLLPEFPDYKGGAEISAVAIRPVQGSRLHPQIGRDARDNSSDRK